MADEFAGIILYISFRRNAGEDQSEKLGWTSVNQALDLLDYKLNL